MAPGAFVAAAALGWIPAPTDSFHAPRDIVLLAGMLFVLAGASIVANDRLPAWTRGFIGACIWTMFALIPSWIAWGSGPREFSGDGVWLLDILGLSVPSIGRVIFGLSALLMWLGAGVAWWTWLAALPLLGRIAAIAALLGVVAWFGGLRDREPAWVVGEGEAERLAKYIAVKHADPDFAADGQNPFLRPRAETWIKQSRARLAAARVPPPGVRVIDLPTSGDAPKLDGVIGADEWRGAKRLVSNAGRRARFFLLVHGKTLFIAGEAPADRTEGGFDQMRFWFHLRLAPALANERVFLSRNGGVTALRAVRPPGRRSERTEWNVLDGISGASAVDGHRTFELAIDLEEAALPPGTAFPFFLEIEGDPIRTPEGKFKARLTEGRAGTYDEPLWARVPDRDTLTRH